MKSGKYYIFCISIIKSPKKFETIQSSHCNYGSANWKKQACDNNKAYSFFFDLIKNVDKTVDHEIDFIIKHNETLAGHFSYLTIIDKYKYRNEIQVNGKQ